MDDQLFSDQAAPQKQDDSLFSEDPAPQAQSGYESAARGALRNFPLAQQAAAAIAPINPLSEKSNYTEELAHLTQAAEQGKKENPWAYGAGAVAGSVAPALIPGAGEALEAAPVLGNAALGAAQNVSDTNVLKDPLKAAGEAAVGGVIGAGIGKIGQGLQAAAPSENALGASMTGTGLGFNARGAQKLMTGADPEADVYNLGKWATSVKDDAGNSLSDYVRPGDRLKALGQIHDAAGEKIGDIIDKVAPKVPVSVTRLKQELTPILEDVADINPTAEAKVSGIFKRLDKLDESGKLNFDSLQKLKSSIGKNMGDEPAMERAYGAVSEYMDKVIDAYGQYVKDPEIKAGYDAARMDYRNASRLLPILRKFEGKEIAQGPLGNSGLLGMIGGAGALAAGHPVGAAATMAGSAVGRPLVNTIGRNMALRMAPNAGAIAAAGRGLSRAAQMELEDALTSKFGTKKP